MPRSAVDFHLNPFQRPVQLDEIARIESVGFETYIFGATDVRADENEALAEFTQGAIFDESARSGVEVELKTESASSDGSVGRKSQFCLPSSREREIEDRLEVTPKQLDPTDEILRVLRNSRLSETKPSLLLKRFIRNEERSAVGDKERSGTVSEESVESGESVGDDTSVADAASLTDVLAEVFEFEGDAVLDDDSEGLAGTVGSREG
jgi:hypothetical protein